MPKKTLKANQSTLNLSETAEKPPLQRRSSAKTQQENKSRLQAVAPKRHSITALPQAAKEKLNAKKQVIIFNHKISSGKYQSHYFRFQASNSILKETFRHII